MRSRLLLALALFTAPLCAADLAGTYSVNGKNPNGTAYKGSLTIAQAGSAWKLNWKTGSESSGIGVELGDVLAVAVGGAQCAPVAYQVAPEGGLVGVWTLPAGGTLASEQATPGVGTTQGIAGDYVVNGNNLDGSPYKGALSVHKESDHWRFSWRTGTNSEGYGIENDGRIGVSVGAPTCGVVLYRIGTDGSLKGNWKYRGTAGGTEDAARS